MTARYNLSSASNHGIAVKTHNITDHGDESIDYSIISWWIRSPFCSNMNKILRNRSVKARTKLLKNRYKNAHSLSLRHTATLADHGDESIEYSIISWWIRSLFYSNMNKTLRNRSVKARRKLLKNRY